MSSSWKGEERLVDIHSLKRGDAGNCSSGLIGGTFKLAVLLAKTSSSPSSKSSRGLATRDDLRIS